MALKLRRGLNSERLMITPAEGELIYTTDTKLVYVGDGNTVGGTFVGSFSTNGSFDSINATSITVNTISANTANINSVLNVSGHILPTANITYDIGASTKRFRDLYLSGNTIYLGETSITSNLINLISTTANSAYNLANNVANNVNYSSLIGKPNQDLNTSSNVTFNTISHSGLTMTQGFNIDQYYELNLNMQITDEWQDTPIKSTALPTGTYIVQVFANDNSVGGQHYNETYSGLMSWYSSDTDSTIFDEIILHRAGRGPGSGVLFLRVQRTESANSDDLKLQIAGTIQTSGAVLYTFKFRRML